MEPCINRDIIDYNENNNEERTKQHKPFLFAKVILENAKHQIDFKKINIACQQAVFKPN